MSDKRFVTYHLMDVSLASLGDASRKALARGLSYAARSVPDGFVLVKESLETVDGVVIATREYERLPTL